MKRLLALAPIFAAACATTGPYAQPYSVIEDDPVRSANPNVVHVLLNRVDDQNATTLRYAVVPPGRHQVTVDVPPRKGWQATQRTFELVTEPCTRYYISGRLDNPVGPQWTPIVRSQERMGECEKKFAMNR